MGEHAWGQERELVPRKVQAEETSETTPAQGRGEVGQGGGVVQRAAEVEILEGTGRNAQSFWVDQCEPVPTEVKEVQVEEGREAVGIQRCNSVEITVTVTPVLMRFISRSCRNIAAYTVNKRQNVFTTHISCHYGSVNMHTCSKGQRLTYYCLN